MLSKASDRFMQQCLTDVFIVFLVMQCKCLALGLGGDMCGCMSLCTCALCIVVRCEDRFDLDFVERFGPHTPSKAARGLILGFKRVR